MKKIFFVGALALFGAMSAQQFGIKAGMNVASVSNSGGSSKVGFYGGLFMNAPLASQFSIQPELLYSQKGDKTTISGTTLSANMDYLSVPVMFQYNVSPQFYLEAGPEFSFLMSAKAKAAGQTADMKSYLNSFDFGLGLGAGYFFNSNFGLTARYVAGFTDTVKNNTDSASRNGAFQVGLAYKFSK